MNAFTRIKFFFFFFVDFLQIWVIKHTNLGYSGLNRFGFFILEQFLHGFNILIWPRPVLKLIFKLFLIGLIFQPFVWNKWRSISIFNNYGFFTRVDRAFLSFQESWRILFYRETHIVACWRLSFKIGGVVDQNVAHAWCWFNGVWALLPANIPKRTRFILILFDYLVIIGDQLNLTTVDVLWILFHITTTWIIIFLIIEPKIINHDLLADIPLLIPKLLYPHWYLIILVNINLAHINCPRRLMTTPTLTSTTRTVTLLLLNNLMFHFHIFLINLFNLLAG